MTKERENEIRQMSRETQESLLFELREISSLEQVFPCEPTPAVCDTREVISTDEEIELLEELLRESASTQL
jgi:hypothetical protein